MAAKIVLFGATGYTGRLTAHAMRKRGLRPLLAARSRQKLEALAAEVGGGVETAVADVSDPPSLTRLLERGDVLVTTVGPFVRFGAAAAAATATQGAHYIDSTGEPPFIREVFERYDRAARKGGSGMLTAFGYDFVPGNLAGALALRQAGEAAVRVDTGYFVLGRGGAENLSGGTRASLAGILFSPGFAWRDGRIREERSARRYRSFPVHGKERPAISVAASEHFALPRVAPRLREVNAYLGWFGPVSRPLQAASLAGAAAMRVPKASALWEKVASRLVQGSTGGPDEATRAGARSHIVAMAYDAARNELAEVHLTGADPYGFTADIMAWGAERAASGALKGTGALGPVDGFGLEPLREGCAEAGLTVEDGPPATARAKPPPETARA